MGWNNFLSLKTEDDTKEMPDKMERQYELQFV